MTQLWAGTIATYRANMVTVHERARATMESHGVTFTDLTPAEAKEVRDRMLPEQDAVAKVLKVSPESQELMMQDLGGSA